jgi:hypothetical protein
MYGTGGGPMPLLPIETTRRSLPVMRGERVKCRTCGQPMHERGGEDADHHLHVMFDGRCLGCFVFSVELDKFLIRSRPDRMGPMGDWEDGWMKAILENPREHLK